MWAVMGRAVLTVSLAFAIVVACPSFANAKDSRGTNNSPFVVEVISSPIDAAQADARAKQEQEKAFNDTWLTRFTASLVVVGLLQALLFWWQLWLIRGSLNDAKLAAEAAKESADATKSVAAILDGNGRKQMRAYVSVLVGGEVPQDLSTGWKYEVRMILKNTGFTPAQAVNSSIRLSLINATLPDTFDFVLPVTRHIAKGHIPSGQTNMISACLPEFLTDEEIKEMKVGGNLALFIWGTVWYKDVFNDEHITNFCQIARWDVKGIFSTINADLHNDAT